MIVGGKKAAGRAVCRLGKGRGRMKDEAWLARTGEKSRINKIGGGDRKGGEKGRASKREKKEDAM